VVLVLFAVIFAVIMIIIYGGIQPDGLVLSRHKVLINTTALNRWTILLILVRM
jgi:hypothetical protein